MAGNDEFSWDDLADGRDPVPRASDGLGILPRSPAEALEPARPPRPPGNRRMRREPSPRISAFVRTLTGGLTFALMAMVTVAVAIYVARYHYNRTGPLQHSTVVVIPKGDGVNAIADRLVREGVLNDRWLFMLGVMRFGAERKLKAGEYEFPQRASVRQVLDILVEGRAILHKVTVPEGRTSFEVVEILNSEPILKGEITRIPPEGSLLPDTYRFSRGADRQELLDRMSAEMDEFLDSVWATRQPGLPIQSKEEALVLASIVEKETGRADERDRVASVFVNRLNRGMRLESDPTIIYGITRGKGTLGRGLRRSEIDQKTPYNTYQIDGLPPTPICNPGRSAIEAVLNPATTDDIFFVADGTGGHAFSQTLAEHRENVKKWRVVEKEIRAEQRARAAAQAAEAESGEEELPGLAITLDEGTGTAMPLPLRRR